MRENTWVQISFNVLKSGLELGLINLLDTSVPLSMLKLHFSITLKSKNEFPMFALLVGNADRMMPQRHQEKGGHPQAQKNSKVAGHQQSPLLPAGQPRSSSLRPCSLLPAGSGVHVYVLRGEWKNL